MDGSELAEWMVANQLNKLEASEALGIARNTLDRYLKGGAPRTIELACAALSDQRDLLVTKQRSNDDFSGHELLHMASVMSDVFDRHILDHAATKADAALSEAATSISDSIAAFYQQCAAKSVDG